MWRRKRYKKSPSFLSIHIGVRAEALPAGTQCHHIIVEDWARMEEPFGTLFVSIPTLLDPSLSPDGTHIVHVFSPDWIDNWKVRSALPCLYVYNAVPCLTVQALKGPACHQDLCLWKSALRTSNGPVQELAAPLPFHRAIGMYCLWASLFPHICRRSVWQSMSGKRRRLQTAL